MKDKISLQSALTQNLDNSQNKVLQTSETTKKDMKKMIVDIPLEAHRQIDFMRLQLEKPSMRHLVIEALNDLFKKYNYPPIA